MGLQNQLELESILQGKPVEDLITEALATSKTQTEAAGKLNISRQALSKRLLRLNLAVAGRKRRTEPQR